MSLREIHEAIDDFYNQLEREGDDQIEELKEQIAYLTDSLEPVRDLVEFLKSRDGTEPGASGDLAELIRLVEVALP